MRIAIFFALDDEFYPLRNLAKPRAGNVKLLTEGRFAKRLGLTFTHAGHEVLIANTGSGAANADAWAGADEFAGCDWFLAAGVAGGISPSLATGDIVFAEHVWRRQPGHFDLVHTATNSPLPFTVALPGDVVTVPHVLITRQEKEMLHASFGHEGRRAGAVLADMESASIAQGARQRGAKFAALRAISDAAGEDLPLDFNEYLDAEGNVSRARVMREAMTRPTLIRQLTRLGRNTKVACLRLAEAVWQWVERVE